MKRLVIPVVLLAGVVAVVAVNAAAKGKPTGPGPGGHAIHVVEHAISDAVTNGSASDAAGNVLTFANPVYDRKDAQQVGSDQGYCVRIVVGQTWECNWTTFLPKGQITVEGPFSDTGNTVLAITGGTGKYRNARGAMELDYHNQAGTEFDFVFHVIG
jgi:allene oxide cyclase